MSYEKFFKEAQKASGLSQKPTSKGKSNGSMGAAKKIANNQNRFKIKTDAQSKDTPEDRLRAELAKRMRNKKQLALSRKKKLPIYPVLCTVAIAAVCGATYTQFDRIDNWLNRIEIGIFGQAGAAEEAASGAAAQKAKNSEGEKNSAAPTAKKEKSAETTGAVATKGAPQASTEAPPIKQWTTEELSFFSKLNDRKQELDQREADLNKLEEELQKRQGELDKKLKSLEAMRAEISKTLKTRVATDQEKVEKLVQFYSSMKAQQAAKVIESLNEDLAVEVLDKMKKKSAAEIMDAMDSKKARRLSELLTGYERTPASLGDGGKPDADGT